MPCLSSSVASDFNDSTRLSNALSQVALPFRITTLLAASAISSPNGSAVWTEAAGRRGGRRRRHRGFSRGGRGRRGLGGRRVGRIGRFSGIGGRLAWDLGGSLAGFASGRFGRRLGSGLGCFGLGRFRLGWLFGGFRRGRRGRGSRCLGDGAGQAEQQAGCGEACQRRPAIKIMVHRHCLPNARRARSRTATKPRRRRSGITASIRGHAIMQQRISSPPDRRQAVRRWLRTSATDSPHWSMPRHSPYKRGRMVT